MQFGGMKYKSIQIEKKYIYEDASLFLLIWELTKIISFVQIYNFFKKYNNYNIFFLILPGFLICLSKTIYYLLFMLLKYPFNENLYKYLINLINALIVDWEDFKIEIFHGSISFNAGSKIPVNFNTSRLNSRFGINAVTTRILNANTIYSEFSRESLKLVNIWEKLQFAPIFHSQLFYRGQAISKELHFGLINKAMTGSLVITNNCANRSIIALGGVPIYFTDKQKDNNFNKSGVVVNMFDKDWKAKIISKSPNQIAYSMIMHLIGNNISPQLRQKLNLLNEDFLIEVEKSVNILVTGVGPSMILKENMSYLDLQQAVRITCYATVMDIIQDKFVNNGLEHLKPKENFDE